MTSNVVNKTSVVHIISGLNVGGAETMLYKLISASPSEQTPKYTVVSLTDLGLIGKKLEQIGVDVYCMHSKSYLDTLKCIYKIVKLLKKLNPDIVHTWLYHSDLLGGVAAKLANVRIIVWCVRSTDVTKGGKKLTLLVRKLAAFLSHRLPTRIVYAANKSRVVHESLGYSKKKGFVIPNGFDLNYMDSQQYNLSRSLNDMLNQHKKILVGSVGRYHPVKDHQNFIDAAFTIIRKRKDVVFVLIGEGLDESNAKIIDLLESAGVRDRFLLLGQREDVLAIYPLFTIFCLHSLSEGFPNVLGEAMASSVPSISTNVGDAKFLLGDESFIVPPRDSNALSEKIEKLLNMENEQRISIGKKNRLRIEKNFSIQSVKCVYEGLYSSLLNS